MVVVVCHLHQGRCRTGALLRGWWSRCVPAPLLHPPGDKARTGCCASRLVQLPPPCLGGCAPGAARGSVLSWTRVAAELACGVAQDLVLLGGGHSHVHVLKSFAMQPLPGVRLTLITRDVHTPYSGMLPGYVAGACRGTGGATVKQQSSLLEMTEAHIANELRFNVRAHSFQAVQSVLSGIVPHGGPFISRQVSSSQLCHRSLSSFWFPLPQPVPLPPVPGHYAYDDCHVDLRPLARLAAARLLHCTATALDCQARLVHLQGRPPIPYDVLSIDIGITPLQVSPHPDSLLSSIATELTLWAGPLHVPM